MKQKSHFQFVNIAILVDIYTNAMATGVVAHSIYVYVDTMMCILNNKNVADGRHPFLSLKIDVYSKATLWSL